MASDNLAKQMSSSWVIEEVTTTITLADQFYQEFAAQGQSFFQASGDSGAYYSGTNGTYSSGVYQFADTPYVTIVGGTTLTTAGPGGPWVSEAVWNWGTADEFSSGGGISQNYSIPTWQQGISMTTNHGSTTMRNSPDVAMTADNIMVVADNGSNEVFGGTSATAPLWAGFTALVNQQAALHAKPVVGFLNPAIYAIGKGANYTLAFDNITTGNNTSIDSSKPVLRRHWLRPLCRLGHAGWTILDLCPCRHARHFGRLAWKGLYGQRSGWRPFQHNRREFLVDQQWSIFPELVAAQHFRMAQCFDRERHPSIRWKLLRDGEPELRRRQSDRRDLHRESVVHQCDHRHSTSAAGYAADWAIPGPERRL